MRVCASECCFLSRSLTRLFFSFSSIFIFIHLYDTCILYIYTRTYVHRSETRELLLRRPQTHTHTPLEALFLQTASSTHIILQRVYSANIYIYLLVGYDFVMYPDTKSAYQRLRMDQIANEIPPPPPPLPYIYTSTPPTSSRLSTYSHSVFTRKNDFADSSLCHTS